MTADELRETLGVKVRAFQIRWKNEFAQPYAKDHVATPEQVARMNELYSKRPKQPAEKRIARRTIEPKRIVAKKSWADSIPGATTRQKAFNATCIAIVIGHAAFIWFDCASLWSAPGFIAGMIAFLIIFAALLIATDPTRGRTSGNAVTFAIIVDLLASVAHYQTFQQWNNQSPILSACVAAFVCICSAVAIGIYRDEKRD